MTYKYRIVVDNSPNAYLTVCYKCAFHNEPCALADHLTNQDDFLTEVGSCLTRINSYYEVVDED